MLTYFIYHLRWQFATAIMLPLMLFLEKWFPLWGNLILGQAFGALIFWFIDKRIFGYTGKKHLNN